LKEGDNNITIRATDGFGTVNEENISLFIDSREPRISRTLPRRNSVTNGTGFFVRYTEINLKDVFVSWNPSEQLVSCNVPGKNQECTIDLDLTAFDGQEIEYWFNVSDDVRSVESRRTKIKVDTTKPNITINLPLNDSILDRRVQFNISVSEDVKLEYLDNTTSNPRFRRLCSNCDEYGESRKRTKSFREGVHNLTIRATDKAGQTDVKAVSFEVI